MTKSLILVRLAAGSGLAASNAESIEGVKKGEATLCQSLMRRDTATLAKLMTDDFVRIPPPAPTGGIALAAPQRGETEWRVATRRDSGQLGPAK